MLKTLRKKEKIKQQTDGVKDMIKQTEGSIDDIADNAGPYTSKVKNVLRAKGNLEVIKIKLKDGSMDKKAAGEKVKKNKETIAQGTEDLQQQADDNKGAIADAKDGAKDGKGGKDATAKDATAKDATAKDATAKKPKKKKDDE
jgi:hypothetical protein